MSRIKHIIQRIKEGRLKQLIAELLWMYAYVRRYWAADRQSISFSGRRVLF